MTHYWAPRPEALPISLQTTTGTINPTNTSTAMKIPAMSSKKTKSHVFSSHKKNAKQLRPRVGNRVMSMESLAARLALVPNKATAPTASPSSGTETRAKITSPSTTFTENLKGNYQTHAIGTADENTDAIFRAIYKPKLVEAHSPLNEESIYGAVRLILGVSCDLSASDGHSTPPSEIFTAKDSASCSSIVIGEKASDGGDNCENEEGENGDEKREDNSPYRHRTLSRQAFATQAMKNNKHVTLRCHQASDPRCTRVGLPPLSVIPAPGTALGLLGPSFVPIAFLPTYTNEIKIASIEPDGVSKVPAYARPSMSSWFRSPKNSSIQGTVQDLTFPTRPRRTHRVEARPFVRNTNEIVPQNMPEVPKEGPTPWVKRLPMYKAVIVSGFEQK